MIQRQLIDAVFSEFTEELLWGAKMDKMAKEVDSQSILTLPLSDPKNGERVTSGINGTYPIFDIKETR